MKHSFLHRVLWLLIPLLTLFITPSRGAEAVYKTAKFGSAATTCENCNQYNSSTAWTSTYNGFSVSVLHGSNNNCNWANVRFGSKTITGSLTGTIVTGSIDKKVSKVSISLTNNNSKTTSIKLYTSTNGSSWTERGTFAKSSGTQSVSITSANQAANLYYKVEIITTQGSGNGFVQISQIDYYVETFTMTYNANGGSGTLTDSNSPYFNGSTVTVKSNSFTRTNYTFNHWDTKSDDSGTDYAAGNTFTITANTTLYAQWDLVASCTTNATVSAGSLKGSVSSSSEATAQCTGGITSLGSAGCSITSYGFAVGTSTGPIIGNALTGTGKTYQVGTTYTTTSTAFEKVIDGLSASTKYYVRPYATNGNGTAYGTEFNFTTLAACTTAPTVTAGSTGTITKNTAVVNCTSGITSLGTGGCSITSYGFAYGTSANPTISGTKVVVGTEYTSTGTSFTATLTGLTEGQTYYVRPYATNGYGTAYGDQVTFGTPKITVVPAGLVVAFGDKKVGGTYTETFTVSGVNLQGNITLTPSAGCSGIFSIDKTSITPTSGSVTNEVITITYTPTTAGSHGGGSVYINVASSNAQTRSVMPTGTGKWEVTWDVSGSTPTTTLVANNEKPTLPDPAGITSCDGTSTTFIGWTKTPWVGKQNQAYIDGLTGDNVVHTANTTMSNVTENGTTYYAVFAEGSLYYGRLTSSELSSLAAGNKLVIVAVDQGYVLKNDLTCSNTVPSETDGVITPSNDLIWELAGSAGAWQLKSGSNVLGTLYDNCAGSGNGLALNFNTYHQTYSIASSSHSTNEFYIKDNSCTYGVLTKISKYDAFRDVYVSSYSSDATAALKLYTQKGSYSNYLTTCCNMPTLAFAASPYAVIRQDIQGASTTTWAEVDVTFTSNNTTGTISATTYTDSKTVYSIAWGTRGTTGGSLCATNHAYFEVLTQPSGETPGTGKFHVKTTSGQTGQGTYRIAITQASTDESHGNYCETTVYGFVDVTLRDKFVDAVNGNGTVNKDGHGAQLATPILSELGTQVENACHSEGRKLKGWIKETDLKSKYETGNSERVQTIDGLCETCDDATDWTSLIVAPGTNVTMSGATWYAVWAYER